MNDEQFYENLWGSIVVFTNDLIDDRKAAYPNTEIGFIDWEAHANIFELPDNDLIGTTALTFTEDSPQEISVSFAIGVSTFTDDTSLFRLRNYVGKAYSRMRPGQKIAFYDCVTLEQLGWLHLVDGTIVAPMTKADVRPLQFIQCHAVLDPVTAQA